MALIVCPECGKEISDKASQCIHCGYPLSRNNPVRRRLITVLAIAALTVAAVVALTVLFGLGQGNPNVCFPYGILHDMSMEETHRLLTENGYVRDFDTVDGYRTDYLYESRHLYGAETYFTILSKDTYHRTTDLGHIYQEDDIYGTANPGPLFDSLRRQLIEEYGAPSHESSGVCTWENGPCVLRLYYVDEVGGDLWIDYVYQP